MSNLSYFLRTRNGKPVLDELFAINPWFVAEAIVQNATMVSNDHFQKGRFPDEIKVDLFVSTVKRKVCSQTNTHVYEVFFDNLLLPVTFLSIGCYNGDSVVLHSGVRDRRIALHRLSGYPYLDPTVTRLEQEFGLPTQNFAWTLRQAN